jgi:hypothetical protein
MPDGDAINERLSQAGARVFERLARLRDQGRTPNTGAMTALETAVQALALADRLLATGADRVRPEGDLDRLSLRKHLETGLDRLSDSDLDLATAMFIESTKTLLAASAVDQCEEEDPYEPMWRVRRNGKIMWTCGHQPPHESDA